MSDKKKFGAGLKAETNKAELKSAIAKSNDKAPLLQRSHSVATGGPMRETQIRELDRKMLKFGELKKGTADRFIPVDYKGKQLVLSFGTLPNHVRAPFKAGPTRDPATGTILGDPHKYNLKLELDDETVKILQEELYDPAMQYMIDHREDIFPAKTRKEKGNVVITKPAFTEQDVRDAFTPNIKPPTEERYLPLFSLSFNANPDEPGRHPVIEVSVWRGDSISKRTHGSLATISTHHNLVGTWVVALKRGIWISGMDKWGLAWDLQAHLNLINLSGAPSKRVELHGFKEDDDVEGQDAPLALPAPEGNQFDDEANMTDSAYAGYDDGSGNGAADHVPESQKDDAE